MTSLELLQSCADEIPKIKLGPILTHKSRQFAIMLQKKKLHEYESSDLREQID
jgi:hypothetical protein